jgi:poly-gamma-glutamate capsule biosynthesis protein CapA/YwtB (metallophosphatase superfamily)
MFTRRFVLSAMMAVAVGVWTTAAALMQRDPELATTVSDGFTIATVGDLIYAHDLGHMMTDPSFAAVVKLLRSADIATGNLEGIVVDGRTFVGARIGGHGAEPGAADSIRDMGFDLVARPNNHGNDFGPEGLAETSAHLDRVGVQHAGVGNTYAAARAARFVSVPKGRVGMVATTATGTLPAMSGRGEWPGVGGYSTLDVTRYFMIPGAAWDAVRTIREHFPNGTGFYARGANTDEQIRLLGEEFRKAEPGTTEAYYAYEMNQRDLRDLLAAVREGKMRSDFLSVAIHSHHFRDTTGGYRGVGIPEAEHLDTNPSVADYLEVFARAAIDGGADLFQGTGVHVVRGIEIYGNRPIFYGLGEFVRQRDVDGLAGLGGVERDACDGCPFPAKYESFIAISEFHEKELTEVRLHPVELRYEAARLARRGIPRIAPPDTAQRILSRLQELSAPYGTEIVIEGDIGVIRP